MTNAVKQDKYQPGDKVEGASKPTDAEVMAEVLEFEADLRELMADLRQRRNATPPGEARAKLRSVGDKLEDALTDIRKAGNIVRGLGQ